MNPIVKKYYDDYKNQELISRGLIIRTYEPEGEKHDKTLYPYPDSVYVDSKYYRLDPIEISDEDFETLIKVPNFIVDKTQEAMFANITTIKNIAIFSIVLTCISLVGSLIFIIQLLSKFK